MPMVTAMPILRLVNSIEWNSRVILGPLLPPPGETYNKVINAPSIVSKSTCIPKIKSYRSNTSHK